MQDNIYAEFGYHAYKSDVVLVRNLIGEAEIEARKSSDTIYVDLQDIKLDDDVCRIINQNPHVEYNPHKNTIRVSPP